MADIGTEEQPLRVAIVGSGPAGFYTVSHLLKQKDLHVQMDMIDRLPTPFGLVRAGVAPDHPKDKSVVRAYGKSADNPNFRFFGNIEYGRHLTLADLKTHYHQILFATGASVDRDLGIQGEDLVGSHSATEFVAWYNGHPDYAHLEFDLSQENVAIVGVGNVAMDVARILCRSYGELVQTDIADHALEALRHSQVKNVYLLGRRGPAQAAFTPPELKEMGELIDADVYISRDESMADAASIRQLEKQPDKNVEKNLALIGEYAKRIPRGRRQLLTFRFKVSPVEILGKDGRVSAIKIVRNELVETDEGAIRARATHDEEQIPVGLVFRSVGYKGVALADVPFHAKWGTINNEQGRVKLESGEQAVGLYTAGWIKRGPSGVIGTNKTCAQESVHCMMEDLAAGIHINPVSPDSIAAASMFKRTQVNIVSYLDWQKLDLSEISKGELVNRPRIKYTDIGEMLAVIAD